MELRELPIASARSRRIKKFRGFFRKVRKACRADREYFGTPRGNWCNLSHIHIDWKGYGSYSLEARELFLAEYASRFRSLVRTLPVRYGKFQIWILIQPYDSGTDAIWFHTENPHTEFPITLAGISWGGRQHHLFSDLLSEFDMEEGRSEDGCTLAYYARGIGLPLR